MTTNEKLGANIRMVRAKAGVSQAQLAKFLEISPQQLQKYETGANRVSVERLLDVRDGLDVSLSDLLVDLLHRDDL